jgi:hypothetical protein
MSELQNPLFEEEKEFLERKKLEYERALRGDVEHIKDQSVMVGKVALVGAGLAGGVWLISKLFGGKKRKARKKAKHDNYFEGEYDEAGHDYEFGSNHHLGEQEDGYDDGLAHKSAAASAQAFTDQYDYNHEADDLGFGSQAPQAAQTYSGTATALADTESDDFDTEEFEEDPFQDLPYDDSRRLPASHAFDATTEAPAPKATSGNSRSQLVGSVLKAFLQTDTGKVLVAQAAAVAMALVTKKIGEFFPADKNADLATSPGYAADATGSAPVASLAPSVPSDASNPSQSL